MRDGAITAAKGGQRWTGRHLFDTAVESLGVDREQTERVGLTSQERLWRPARYVGAVRRT
jgi:hypothetical protein